MPGTRRLIWLGLFLGVQCPFLAAESAEGERTGTGWGIGRLNRIDSQNCELDLKVLLQVSHESRFVATQLEADRDLMLEEWLEGPTELTGPVKNGELNSPGQMPRLDESESDLSLDPIETPDPIEVPLHAEPPAPSQPDKLSEPDKASEPAEARESERASEPAPLELPAPVDLNPAGGSSDGRAKLGDSQNEKLADALKADTRRQRLFERFAKLQSPPRSISLASPIATKETLPVNQAADLMGQESPRYLASHGLPIPIAPRVHTRLCHEPLYFEEVNLERCGRVDCEDHGCLQNLYSTFWFFTGTTLLPYRLVTEPMGCCVASGSDCRTCQSVSCSIAPLKTKGVSMPIPCGLAAEAAAIAGFTFLLL